MFAVVLSAHDGRVDIGSSAWLTERIMAALWLTGNRPEKLKTLAESAVEPGPTLMPYEVRILHETDEFMN